MQTGLNRTSHLNLIKKLIGIVVPLLALCLISSALHVSSAHAQTTTRQAVMPAASGGGCYTSHLLNPVYIGSCVSENSAHQIIADACLTPLNANSPGLYNGSCTIYVNHFNDTTGHEYVGSGQTCTYAIQHTGGHFYGPAPTASGGQHYHTNVNIVFVYEGDTYSISCTCAVNSPTQIA